MALPYITKTGKLRVTVVEFDSFTHTARKVWSEEELDTFKDYIAEHPLDGALVVGTGGFRKIRWSTGNIGKSGGARVIYFYYDPGHPLFLSTFYGKSSKSDLTAAERNDLREVAGEIKRAFRKTRN